MADEDARCAAHQGGAETGVTAPAAADAPLFMHNSHRHLARVSTHDASRSEAAPRRAKSPGAGRRAGRAARFSARRARGGLHQPRHLQALDRALLSRRRGDRVHDVEPAGGDAGEHGGEKRRLRVRYPPDFAPPLRCRQRGQRLPPRRGDAGDDQHSKGTPSPSQPSEAPRWRSRTRTTRSWSRQCGRATG